MTTLRLVPRAALIFLACCVLGVLPGVGAAAQDALFIDDASNVGIGTSLPNAPLHVLRNDGTAQLVVEEQSGTPQARTLFSLRNNGGSRFALVNTSAGTIWQFNALSNFNIDYNGHAGNELQLQQDGDLIIGGMLTEGSSREIKTAFAEVDAAELLARLAALPISEWSYRSDGVGVRHIGPTAEDFHAAFGLGADDAHVAPGDKAGVALVAIQALLADLAEKEARIEELSARLDALEQATRE